MKITTASKGKLISKSNFSGYTHCLNPYVGCSWNPKDFGETGDPKGCSYCYVQFFLRDKDEPWGQWVRLRQHIPTKLPKELEALKSPISLVMGTMCECWQEAESQYHLTKTSLEILSKHTNKLSKFGIFTKSPQVLNELELLKILKANVHLTICPIPEDVRKFFEPVSIPAKVKFEVIKKLKAAGLTVHVNVAPAIPYLSDKLIAEYAHELGKLQVDSFFVDPVQAYAESVVAMQEQAKDLPAWQKIEDLITNKPEYIKWKVQFKNDWTAAWKNYISQNPNTLPIMCDHESKMRIDMRSNKFIAWKD